MFVTRQECAQNNDEIQLIRTIIQSPNYSMKLNLISAYLRRNRIQME